MKHCANCGIHFDGTETPYLTFNDVFNIENTFHIKCWNNSVFGEVGRDENKE